MVYGLSAGAITFDVNSADVSCVPSLDWQGNLYINIQVQEKTVAPFLLDNNQTSVDSPEANAAVAYCNSVTAQASRLMQQVQINTDARDFDSGEALQVADPYAICKRPPSR